MENQQGGNNQALPPMAPGHYHLAPMYFHQTTAYNFFMMGEGQTNIHFAYPAAQTPMGYYANSGMMASQQPQQQQMMPGGFPTAAGTSVPSPLTINGGQPSKIGTNAGSDAGTRLTRSKSKAVTFSNSPPVAVSVSPPNGNTLQRHGGSDSGNGSSTSDQEFLQTFTTRMLELNAQLAK